MLCTVAWCFVFVVGGRVMSLLFSMCVVRVQLWLLVIVVRFCILLLIGVVCCGLSCVVVCPLLLVLVM